MSLDGVLDVAGYKGEMRETCPSGDSDMMATVACLTRDWAAFGCCGHNWLKERSKQFGLQSLQQIPWNCRPLARKTEVAVGKGGRDQAATTPGRRPLRL